MLCGLCVTVLHLHSQKGSICVSQCCSQWGVSLQTDIWKYYCLLWALCSRAKQQLRQEVNRVHKRCIVFLIYAYNVMDDNDFASILIYQCWVILAQHAVGRDFVLINGGVRNMHICCKLTHSWILYTVYVSWLYTRQRIQIHTNMQYTVAHQHELKFWK